MKFGVLHLWVFSLLHLCFHTSHLNYQVCAQDKFWTGFELTGSQGKEVKIDAVCDHLLDHVKSLAAAQRVWKRVREDLLRQVRRGSQQSKLSLHIHSWTHNITQTPIPSNLNSLQTWSLRTTIPTNPPHFCNQLPRPLIKVSCWEFSPHLFNNTLAKLQCWNMMLGTGAVINISFEKFRRVVWWSVICENQTKLWELLCNSNIWARCYCMAFFKILEWKKILEICL